MGRPLRAGCVPLPVRQPPVVRGVVEGSEIGLGLAHRIEEAEDARVLAQQDLPGWDCQVALASQRWEVVVSE